MRATLSLSVIVFSLGSFNSQFHSLVADLDWILSDRTYEDTITDCVLLQGT